MNITKICKKYNHTAETKKFPTHFLQLNRCKEFYNEISCKKGVGGGTVIPEHLVPDFFLWLSPTTAQMVRDGKPMKDIMESLC